MSRIQAVGALIFGLKLAHFFRNCAFCSLFAGRAFVCCDQENGTFVIAFSSIFIRIIFLPPLFVPSVPARGPCGVGKMFEKIGKKSALVADSMIARHDWTSFDESIGVRFGLLSHHSNVNV